MPKFSRIIIFVLSALLISLLVLCKLREVKNLGESGTPLPSAQEVLAELSLEEKIGQLLLIGFEGKEMSPELEESLKPLYPGGVLLLSRNIDNRDQLKNLVKGLQEISLRETGLPLFVAVDQEGEPICRIDFLGEKMPQSEINNAEDARKTGLERGKELKELGVNLNLSPVLDIGSSGDFLFSRTFQKNAEETGILAKSLILGQKQAGVLTAVKHFPGYGGISFDPERGELPVLSKIPETSQFQEAIGADPEMMMVANVIYTQIDEELPFSMSPTSIQFLKNEVQGDYLVISDDLSSPVLKKEFTLEKSIISAVKAGVNIVLVAGFEDPEDPFSAYNFLLQAVKNKEVPMEKIDESVLKIIQLKQRLSY